MKKKSYLVPYDREGNLLSYWDGWTKVTHCHPRIWEDTFEIIKYERGRSSAIFIARSVNDNRTYPIFMSDFMKMLPIIIKGVIVGRFTEVKKGMNFGIQIVEE